MKRINQAYIEGSRSRDLVLKTYRHAGLESEIAISAANFDYAIQVLAVKATELKYAGVRGQAFGEIMSHVIEGAANSLHPGRRR